MTVTVTVKGVLEPVDVPSIAVASVGPELGYLVTSNCEGPRLRKMNPPRIERIELGAT